MLEIIAATGNPGKLEEIRIILSELGVSVQGLDKWPDIIPPEEDGNTFAENARLKAIYYSRKTGTPCLADDSGLVVDALNGMPGVYSARFAVDECPPDADRKAVDMANNIKLVRLLENVPELDRSARFVCSLALANDDTVLLEAEGTVEGRIISKPAGTNGFGYDPHFYIDETRCTTAELSAGQKNLISHRGKAIRDLATRLRKSDTLS